MPLMFNIKLRLSLVLILISAGCASNKVPPRATVTSQTSDSSSGNRPEWITDLEKGCSMAELCAVGEAAGHMMAEAEARKSLSKYFETRVKSKTKITNVNSTEYEGDVASKSEAYEDYEKTIEELSDEVLKGVVIKQKWEDRKEGSVFALAVLKKSAGANLFKESLDKMDEKIVDLYKSGKRAELNSALKLMDGRKALNERYQLLAGRSYPEKVSLSQVMTKKRAKPAITVGVDYKGPDTAKDLKAYIGELLIQNDYGLSKLADGGAFKVQVTLEEENMHVNIKGFEKHKFILKIRSLDKSGNKVGGLGHTEEQIGRSKTDAFHKSMAGFKRYLAENLNQLNMD